MPDYSFIANTGQQQPQQQFNPLAQVGQIAQLQDAINRNQEFQANRLAGQLYQQAVDPSTGQLDTNKLVTLGSQNSGAALAMPNLVAQAQQRKGEQLTQAKFVNQYMNQGLASLLSQDNVGQADVVKFLTTAKANGVLPQQQYDATMQELTQVPPDQVRGWLTRHMVAGMDTGNQINFMYGQHTAVNQGNQTTLVQAPLSGGPMRTVGALPNTLTPAERVKQVPGPVGPNGEPTVITQGQYATQTGNADVVTGRPQSPLGTGRLPPALRNPNAPGGGAPPSAPAGGAPQPQTTATSSQPMQTELGPAQKEALARTAALSSDMANQLTASANESPQRQAMLNAMLGDLTQFSSGPNTPVWSNMMGRMTQVLSGLGVKAPAGADAQASRENFAKMTSQFAQLQAQKLGITTNDKLSVAFASNPNEVFTNLGNQGVIHVLQGNEDALQAKNNAWVAAQQQGARPEQHSQWVNNFNQNFDPRVFWLQRMTPQERSVLFQGMSDADITKLRGNLRYAINQGWVNPNTLATQGPKGGY